MAFFQFGDRSRQPAAIIPLTANRALEVQLRADSLFDEPGILRSYLNVLETAPGNPDDSTQRQPLAWMRADGSEYIVGGRWRRRNDIGEIVELNASSNKQAEQLLDRLLDSYRANNYDLILLGFGEQDRARSFYTNRGFVMLEDVIYYEWRAQRLPELPAGLIESNALRLCTPADLAGLIEVDNAAFPWLWWNSHAEMRWYSQLDDVELWLLEDESGRIIGYTGGTMYYEHERGHLDRLAVHPDVQGRGYGALLLHNALKRFVANGAREVALSTQQDNYTAQRLYKRYGFKRSSIHFHVYGRWIGDPVFIDE